MKIKSVSLFFFLSLLPFLAPLLYTETIPPDLLQKTKEYPLNIESMVKDLEPAKLINDDYFLKVLSKVLVNKEYSAEEKVYYFYLTLKKFKWASYGVAWIQAPDDYVNSFITQSSTFTYYRQKLCKLNINTNEYYKLCIDNAGTKPILSAYSLLLGSILEKDETTIFKEIETLVSSDIYKHNGISGYMIIHNTCLASTLIKESKILPLLQTMYDNVDCEEVKEDIACAILFTNTVEKKKILFTYLVNENNPEHDFLVGTCISAIKKLVSLESFISMLDSYEKYSKDQWKIDLINTIRNNNYEVPYLKMNPGVLFTKSWDNVDLTLYDDGLLVNNGSNYEFYPKIK